jgi:hypothetical protein
MPEEFDRRKALGDIPASHAARMRFLDECDRSVIDTIRFGVLFVMAFWSMPAVKAFTHLKRVLEDVDPDGWLELVVVDTDGSGNLHEVPEFCGCKLSGSGETFWIHDGRILFTSVPGYNPDCFEPNTRRLLAISPDA